MPNSVSSVHNINAVHPSPDEQLPVNVISDEQPSRKTQHLFAVSKHKRSFDIVTYEKHRIIRVTQYVQQPTDFYDETQPRIPANLSSNPLLFFIHGVGASSNVWDPQIHYFLLHGYEVVTTDLLGHGTSAKPTDLSDYEFHKLATDLLEVFDKFCKHVNILIGHSYGSSFCTLIARERSDCVAKVVLISGGGPTPLVPERCSAFALPMPLFYAVKPILVKMFRRMAFHKDTTEVIRDKVATFDISSFVLKAVMEGQKWAFSTEEYHAELRMPVLLLHGRGDRFVALGDQVWMNETINCSSLRVIENAGHMAMVEAPTTVNQLIHDFLNRDSTTRSINPAHVIDKDVISVDVKHGVFDEEERRGRHIFASQTSIRSKILY